MDDKDWELARKVAEATARQQQYLAENPDEQQEVERKHPEATARQMQYFSGNPGSAKHLAHEMRTALTDFAEWPSRLSEGLESEMREISRQDMLKALESCDSEFFRQITKIATALERRDAQFFRQIANGLEQLMPSGFAFFPADDPMQFVHTVYQQWMWHFPKKEWFAIWTLPGYEPFALSGLEPTKQQMRELTQRLWAINRLVRLKCIDPCSPTEQQSPEVEVKIDAEIKRLPRQKWQRLWQRAGLSHLKAGRSGRKTMDKSPRKNGIVR